MASNRSDFLINDKEYRKVFIIVAHYIGYNQKGENRMDEEIRVGQTFTDEPEEEEIQDETWHVHSEKPRAHTWEFDHEPDRDDYMDIKEEMGLSSMIVISKDVDHRYIVVGPHDKSGGE